MQAKIPKELHSERLDMAVAWLFPKISRSAAKRLIEAGNVSLNRDKAEKPSIKVKEGDIISITVPPSRALPLEGEALELDILYEDKDIIVVNKQAGLVVHPGAGVKKGTLVNAILHHCKDLSGIGGVLRPGIVHRLDKGTSGVMVIAKNDAAHLDLSAQFKARQVEKRYLALVYGRLATDSGEIVAPIGRHRVDRKKMSTVTNKGRAALTQYTVKERFGRELTYVDIKLGTGRTHQIRVHFSHLGHPLVGDDLYGGKAIKRLFNELLLSIVKIFNRPFLHSHKLGFKHPETGKYMEFTAGLPSDMETLLNELRNFKSFD